MRVKKPHQAEFVRVKEFEDSFKKRYGKDVEVYRALTLSEEGELKGASVHIICPEGKYVITEVLNEEQKTDHVFSGIENEQHKYRTYLEAEVFVADLIGDKKWRVSQKDIHSAQRKQ